MDTFIYLFQILTALALKTSDVLTVEDRHGVLAALGESSWVSRN